MFINCNICINLVQDADGWGSCEDERYMGTLLTLLQFFCASNTALKNKVYLKGEKRGKEERYYILHS